MSRPRRIGRSVALVTIVAAAWSAPVSFARDSCRVVCATIDAELTALDNVARRLGREWVARNRSVLDARRLQLASQASKCGLELTERVAIVAIAHDWRFLARRFALRHGLEPKLLEALILVESGGLRTAVSPKGAKGYTQLMPATARDLRVDDPFDPAANIEGGARYLRSLLDRFGGDVRRSLAAYNFGPERVERGERWPKETRGYVRRVMERARGM
jgi:soluble lytic murein transglycosylase-like protein